MKRIIIPLLLSMTALICNGKTETTTYYINNPDYQENAAEAIANKYAKDETNKLLLKSQIKEAFGKYFGNKNSQARNLYEQSKIDELNTLIKNQKETINKLEADVKNLSKDGILKKHQNSIDSLKDVYNTKLTISRDSVSDLEIKKENLTTENEKLKERVNDMEKDAYILSNIKNRITEHQNALSQTFMEYNGQSLESITNPEEAEKIARSYEELFTTFELQISPENKAQIAKIRDICKVSRYYQEAKESLAGKYDKKTVEALIKREKELGTSKGSLKDMQATELAGITNALQNENRVIRNFRNFILDKLKNEGSLPDLKSIQQASNLINENFKYSPDSNETKNGYNSYYVHINAVLAKLRTGIKDAAKRDFTDEKKFAKFLDEISKELGDTVN